MRPSVSRRSISQWPRLTQHPTERQDQWLPKHRELPYSTVYWALGALSSQMVLDVSKLVAVRDTRAQRKEPRLLSYSCVGWSLLLSYSFHRTTRYSEVMLTLPWRSGPTNSLKSFCGEVASCHIRLPVKELYTVYAFPNVWCQSLRSDESWKKRLWENNGEISWHLKNRFAQREGRVAVRKRRTTNCQNSPLWLLNNVPTQGTYPSIFTDSKAYFAFFDISNIFWTIIISLLCRF